MRRITLLCCLFLLQFALCSKADITFNPLYLVVYAPGGNGYGAMTITNPTQQPVRLQLGILEWEFTPDKDIQIKQKEPGKETLSDFVKISPKQFTLAPLQKKVVRVACNLPSSYPANAEYKLLFNMTEIGADRKMIDGPGSAEGTATYGLVINKAINAGAYIRTGKPDAFKFDLKFSNFSAKLNGDDIEYQFDYQNSGNRHAREDIGVKIYDQSGKLVLEKPSVGGLVIFPEGDKSSNLKTSFAFPQDKLSRTENYSLEFVFTDNSLEGSGSANLKNFTSAKIPLVH